MSFQAKNMIFALVFFAIFVVVVLTLTGVIAVGGMIGSFPATLVWAATVIFSFFILSVAGYFTLFKKWAAEIDREDAS